MFVEELREIREEYLRNVMKTKLLERESKNIKPPKWQFDFNRGLFEIPFQTQIYQDWVSI